MSPATLRVTTIVFADTERTGGSVNPVQLDDDISFEYLTSIWTLSDRSIPGEQISGLMHTPSVTSELCAQAELEAGVPANTTRSPNLPSGKYRYVALAPWLSTDCVQEYLSSARSVNTEAFLFYLPGGDAEDPPDPDSSDWELGDDGDWMTENDFPIFALTGQAGELLDSKSANYSGDMLEVPNGSELAQLYDSRDYVRLFASVDRVDPTSFPSLWLFLLVVLGIMLAVIASTSLSMHWFQRRRREILRRRVANGEVDLEALGVKRLTVPQQILDRMPLYTYGAGTAVQPNANLARDDSTGAHEGKMSTADTDRTGSRPTSSAENTTERPAPASRPALGRAEEAHHPTLLHQPTCAICLDDYVLAGSEIEGTVVRELPCQHIFHPECVDSFLRDSSSLCPLCKTTTLPKGYCPQNITNAMVRRERLATRLHPQHGDGESRRWALLPGPLGYITRIRQSIRRRISPVPDQPSQPMTDLTSSSPMPESDNRRSAPPVQPPDPSTRREWARQRAVAMLGRRAPLDPDAEEAQQMPRWRKALRGIFPEFGMAVERGGAQQSTS